MQSEGTSSYVNMRLMNIGLQACGVREHIQGLFNYMNGGDMSLTKQYEIICEHEVSNVECLAVGVVLELWVEARFLHKSREVFHSKDKERRRKWIPLAQARRSVILR